MAEESTAIEEETPSASAEERKGSGPGFILGVVLGMLAGAAAATLFAPSTGEELRYRAAEAEGAPAGTTVERIRSVLDRVRARVQEASEEAQAAAREIEAQQRARYAELTGQED